MPTGTPRGPAHLHRLRVAGAAVFQNAADAGAERVFVEPGALTVARHRVDLGAGGLRVPMRDHQAPPCSAICVTAQKVSTLLTWWAGPSSRFPPETAGGCAACRACPPATRSAPTLRRTRRRRRRRGCRCRSQNPARPWIASPSRRCSRAAATPLAGAPAGSGIRRAGRSARCRAPTTQAPMVMPSITPSA
jgi:hypothetical protein